MFAITPVVGALILANVAVVLLERLAGDALLARFELWPLASGLFRPWQLLTYAFLHVNPAHLFFNMFPVFMFGRWLEDYWGGWRLLGFYLICALTAALTQLAVQAAGAAAGPVEGASGAVFGVLLAFGWYFPRELLIMIPIPVPIPAWLFVALYALAEVYFTFTGKEPDLAHFAHLGGMAGAALCILYWRARRTFSS
jgi:membrane associated rhomboid family serine protease